MRRKEVSSVSGKAPKTAVAGLKHWLAHSGNAAAVLMSLVPALALVLFVGSYGFSFPIVDQWWSSVPIAIATANGSLGFDDLVGVTPGGHRMFFTHVHTALFSQWTAWNIRLETFLNPVLGAASFAILICLFAKHNAGNLRWVLVPFSFFVFSTYQEMNWVFSYQTCWHFVNVFLLLMILAVDRGAVRQASVVVSAVFATAASFSMIHGLLCWPLGFLALFLRGYRRIRHYGTWLVATIGVVAAYKHGSGLTLGGDGQSWNAVDLAGVDEVVRVVVSYIAAPLAFGDTGVAGVLGSTGILFLMANALFLYRRCDGWRAGNAGSVWLVPPAFALGVGVMLSLGRTHVMSLDEVVQTRRYGACAIMFWVGLFALMALTSREIRGRTERPWTAGTLARFNQGFGALAVLLCAGTNLQVIKDQEVFYENRFGSFESPVLEANIACLRAFPVTHDGSCLMEEIKGNTTAAGILMLASHRLTVFARPEAPGAFLSQRDPRDPVLVSLPAGWLGEYLRDYILSIVSPDRLYVHVATQGAPVDGDLSRGQQLAALDVTSLHRVVESAGVDQAVWYVSTPAEVLLSDATIRDFERIGYRSERVDVSPYLLVVHRLNRAKGSR